MSVLDTLRQRNPLPEGTLPVGVGIAISGITSLVWLTVAGRVLGPTEFGALSQLWFLVFLFSGAFVPFEQETGRRIAALKALGLGGRSVVQRVVILGGGIAALLVVLSVALAPVLADRLFLGQYLLVLGLVLGAVGYLSANLSQGTLAGNGRFARYGTYLGMDTTLRLAICLGLLAIGVRTAGPIGLSLGIAPLVTTTVLLWGQRELVEPGPEVPWREIVSGLGALLAASVLAQVLINVSPVLVGLYAGPDRPDEAAFFTAALVVARVPLFLFQAVQAALLPRLSRLATMGQLDEFRTGVTRLALLVGSLVVLGSIAGFVIGPWAIETFFGDQFTADHLMVGVLTAASGCFLMAMALSLGLIALGGARLAAAGWAVGVVVLLVVSALGSDPVDRVLAGYAASTATATVAMALLLRHKLRQGAVLEPDHVLEALNDITLDNI